MFDPPYLCMDDSNILFVFLNEHISCDPSLESSRRDNSDDGSKNMYNLNYFLMKTYVVTHHYNRLDKTVLMVGHLICF